MKTVVGLYEDINDAQDAINELVRAGFDRAAISLVAANRWDSDTGGSFATVDEGVTPTEDLSGDVAAGVVTGGVFGGLAGVLLGIGALAIPGLGPVIAAGPLVAGLAGAGIGAAVGGLVGALVNWGVPTEEAELYAEGVRRGGILVGLKTEDNQADRAVEIMNRYSPIDVENRSEYWRSTGWTGYDTSTPAWTADQMVADQMKYSDYLDYSTYTPAFREHYESVYGNSGRDYVLYDPAYRYGYTLARDERFRNYDTWDEIEAEARSGWEATENAVERTWDDFKDAIRRGWEEVKDAFDLDSGYVEFEPGFREHYDTTYVGRGRDYTWYSPAYRYGYDIAMDERWDDYETWDEVEAEARREWETRGDGIEGAWEDFKDAVRHAWEEVRDALDIEADYSERETIFRDHYTTNYRNTGHDYTWYEPSYRYGYLLGLDERYDGYADWDDRLEAEIRRDWETSDFAGQSTWEEIKDAVRRGWESVREAFDFDDDEEHYTTGTGTYSTR